MDKACIKYRENKLYVHSFVAETWRKEATEKSLALVGGLYQNLSYKISLEWGGGLDWSGSE